MSTGKHAYTNHNRVDEDITIFKTMIGYTPESKVLEWLMECRSQEFTLTELVNALKVNKKRAFQFLHYLMAMKIIKLVKKIKNYEFYELNQKSRYVKPLMRFFDEVVR